jgi:hypothetical protein
MKQKCYLFFFFWSYLSIFFKFRPILYRHYCGFISYYVFLNSVTFIVNCIGCCSFSVWERSCMYQLVFGVRVLLRLTELRIKAR